MFFKYKKYYYIKCFIYNNKYIYLNKNKIIIKKIYNLINN